MAIYSLNHRAIGKSTQTKPFTAAAHIRYITRRNALSRLETARFPVETPADLATHFREVESTDRKNARVCDKVMLALPRELNVAERAALVRAFAEAVTDGRAPWVAAFHELGKDAANPHCHLVIRDRDPATGKRVVGMSEAGSTERLRKLWEEHANAALEQAGRDERIDRRTLEEQGVSREPTIHEGPKSRAMRGRRTRPRSRAINVRNGAKSRSRERTVDYRTIDRGRSRSAYNDSRRAAPETARDYWQALDQDVQTRTLEAQRQIHKPDHDPPTFSRDAWLERRQRARQRGRGRAEDDDG